MVVSVGLFKQPHYFVADWTFIGGEQVAEMICLRANEDAR